MKCPRKTTLLKLGVFLLLGAIVNVAVAWGCALWSNPTSRFDGRAEDLPTPIPTIWTVPEGGVLGFRGWGIKSAEVLVFSPCDDDPGYTCSGNLAFIKTGWPSLSLFAERRSPGRVSVHLLSARPTSIHEGIAIPAFLSDWHLFRCLPTRLLWPGFAINTIFYAAILWLLWVAPGKIRRLVRVRQHRCPACGFIIAPNTCANGLCSECGAKLPWRQTPNAALRLKPYFPIVHLPPHSMPPPYSIDSRFEAGWPQVALATNWEPIFRIRSFVRDDHGFQWELVRHLRRPLPGFAINTIFYAAILWLLWIAPGRIRRFVRIRQARCPACGFIIAKDTCANGLCSECGARLPHSLRRSEGM